VTDYDDIGRIVLTGEVTTSAGAGQTLADATSSLSGAFLVGTIYSTAATLPTPYASLVQRFVQNRISSTYTDEDGSAGTTDDRMTTYYSYDPHGNVEWAVHVLPGMTSPIRVEYEYDLITGKIAQTNYQRGYPDQYFMKYTYDADMRIVDVKTSRDSVIWEKDASYTYFPHGPLRRIEVGQEKVSGIDHAYTIHGTLKGINHPSLDPANDPGNDGGGGSDFPKDAFGMTLGYYDDDFVRSDPGAPSPYVSGNSWSHAVKGLYNSNIAGWIHSARDVTGTPTRGLAELYGYDRLNRLRADTGVNRATTPTSWDAKPAGLGAFGSSYEYDPNGNLTKVKRLDAAGGDVDDLTYTPQNANQNRLDRVTDAISAGTSSYTNDINNTQSAGNYVYDNIGNLIKDIDAGIGNALTVGIEWTPYGKIKKITNATYRIEYLYNAAGNRIRQKRTKLSDNSVLTTYYGRDAAGDAVVSMYEKVGTGTTVLKEVSLYGSERLGLFRPDVNQSTTALTAPSVYERNLNLKSYELVDHLDNVRVTVSDRLVKPGADWVNDVKMQTDYFPYGMQREDRNDQVAGYRYGYNGKENDNDVMGEGNQQDYGMRIYDPRVGRFLSVDPLTRSYPSWSPYPFAMGRVIDGVDLDGLEYLKADEAKLKIRLSGGPDELFQVPIVPRTWVGLSIGPSYVVELLGNWPVFGAKVYDNNLISRGKAPIFNNPGVDDAPEMDFTIEHTITESVDQYVMKRSKWEQAARQKIVINPTVTSKRLIALEATVEALKLISDGLETYNTNLFHEQSEYAIRSLTIVDQAGRMDYPGMSDYYKTDARGKAALANYIFSGVVPEGKHWKAADVKYLKELGTQLYNDRDKILKEVDKNKKEQKK